MAKVIDERMAEYIHKATGLTVEQLRTMDHEEIDAAIEKVVGHPLDYALEPGALSSGNMLIDMGRVVTSEEIQRRADKIGRRVGQ